MKSRVLLGVLVCMTIFSLVGLGYAQCTFPDNVSEAAPVWVCSDENPGAVAVDGFRYLATGSAKASKIGAYYDRDQAAVNARNRLAFRIETQVTSEAKNFLAVYGVDQDVADQYNTKTSIQFAHVKLQDCPILATAQSAKGEVYVLIGVNNATGRELAASAMTSSFRNNRADLQRRLGDKEFDKMQSKISEIENNPDRVDDIRANKEPGTEYFRDPNTKELVKLVPDTKKKE
ncbi:MAG: hypothetical protein ACD_15C00137G0017 [uncultured bacterium]|nr:MAG: hypothetical protein ACD_15C00137G0017 [uncultured bacterium]